MSAKNSNSHFAHPNGNMFNRLSGVLAGRATKVLWTAGLALGLAATLATAAEPPATEKPRNVVAVFRLEGHAQ